MSVYWDICMESVKVNGENARFMRSTDEYGTGFDQHLKLKSGSKISICRGDVNYFDRQSRVSERYYRAVCFARTEVAVCGKGVGQSNGATAM